MTTPGNRPSPVGILVNPSSGRDVRRIAARASVSSLEAKRDQVARAVVGAVASGATKVLVVHDLMRIAESAVENLRIHADIEIVAVETCYKARDTELAAEALRSAGCGAVIVLGGDGTNRVLAKTWSDAPLVPLSTGTNIYRITRPSRFPGGFSHTGSIPSRQCLCPLSLRPGRQRWRWPSPASRRPGE